MTTFTSDDREEAYKKIVEAAPNQPGYEDAVPIPPTNQKAQAERNNEPVAYVNSMCNDYIDWKVEPMSIDGQSLYTHPVKDKPHPKCDEACMYLCQMRELTDEEITEVATINLGHSMGLLNWMGFARAILRKAQEK